jgi:TctA family transporter
MVSTPRFTFGFVTLFNGINMMVLMIGLFAVSEVLVQSDVKSWRPGSSLGYQQRYRLLGRY